jgi:hypothetical protein
MGSAVVHIIIFTFIAIFVLIILTFNITLAHTVRTNFVLSTNVAGTAIHATGMNIARPRNTLAAADAVRGNALVQHALFICTVAICPASNSCCTVGIMFAAMFYGIIFTLTIPHMLI